MFDVQSFHCSGQAEFHIWNLDRTDFFVFLKSIKRSGINIDKLVKSPKLRHACEGRHPELFENTGFPPLPSLEQALRANDVKMKIGVGSILGHSAFCRLG
jgi:hypothetical protein